MNLVQKVLSRITWEKTDCAINMREIIKQFSWPDLHKLFMIND